MPFHFVLAIDSLHVVGIPRDNLECGDTPWEWLIFHSPVFFNPKEGPLQTASETVPSAVALPCQRASALTQMLSEVHQPVCLQPGRTLEGESSQVPDFKVLANKRTFPKLQPHTNQKSSWFICTILYTAKKFKRCFPLEMVSNQEYIVELNNLYLKLLFPSWQKFSNCYYQS